MMRRILVALLVVDRCGAFVGPTASRVRAPRVATAAAASSRPLSTTTTTTRKPPKALLPRALALAALVSAPAMARAAEAAAATPHLGEKVAMALQSSGVPDAAIIAAIAAMPVVELRGAIPVGLWMGVPIAKVLALCVLGNMLPIVPLLLLLRLPLIQRVLEKPLAKARAKSDQVLGDNRRAALAAFVGVPFPGTGAWTGGMIAFVLGMPLAEALTSILAGVVSAGLIVTALVEAGKLGALVAVVGLVAIFLLSKNAGNKGDDDEIRAVNA